jgi:hypothetical protein
MKGSVYHVQGNDQVKRLDVVLINLERRLFYRKGSSIGGDLSCPMTSPSLEAMETEELMN